MMMNDLNSAERETLSPLSHDLDGRFSRKGVKNEQIISEKKVLFADTLLIGLFIFFILATDFILFAGSGNIEIFNNSYIPATEILWMLFIILLFTFGIVLAVHHQSLIKRVLASLFVLLVVYIVFKQFAQFDKDVYIGNNAIPIYTVIGIVLAAITYLIYAQKKILYKVLLTIVSGVLFFHILVAYKSHIYDHDFVELHNTQKKITEDDKKFVYMMFPNLISPTYLSTIDEEDALQTKQIIQGFFKKNNFQFYTQAYAPEDHYLKNMIRSFNPRSEGTVVSHLLNTRLLTEYWRFFNLRNDYIFLKNNEIYDIFRRNNFQLSAYKTRDFDMCHKNHKFNVNRCVEKINHPINIFDVNLPVSSRVNILFVEWLDSMQLFGDMSGVYEFLNNFLNLDDFPMLGISYNNLYVVNSIKTFDILLNDMEKDSGKQAYMAFIDLPSDMYIYDEFCQIKPREQWLNMKNLPWVQNDYTSEKRTAYLQQTKCLFGKLEQFVNQLKHKNMWNDTVLVIQGVSGVNDFLNHPINDAKNNFISNHLVTMAIHDNKMTTGSNNTKLCSTTGILSEYLFQNKKCLTEKPIMHESLMDSLGEKLDKLSGDEKNNDVDVFTEWYTKWADINDGYPLFDEDSVYQFNSKEKEEFGIDDFDENIENLNQKVFEQDK